MNKADLKLDISEDFHLRILNLEDVSNAYVGWLNDYDTVKFTEQRFNRHTRENVTAFVKDKFLSDADYLFGMFFQGRHIGNIKLGPIDRHHKIADVSYFIGEKDCLGMGLATKAVKRVLDFGFSVLGLGKINAGYYQNNTGSEKVLSRCGFVVEGVRPEHLEFEGNRIGLVLVGLPKPGK